MTPRVSVVIPCFNAAHWIGEALESVFAQRLPDLEVVVVDDGSTDDSASLVERLFADVKLIRVANGGPGRARNIGTRHSIGQYIQYLDADDRLAPDKLERQLRVIEADQADIVYGDWCELQTAADGSTATGRVVQPHLDGDADVALLTDLWCPPAAYLFRREIVERAGGWDEQQHVVEDVRFLLACVLQGGRLAYCPGLAAMYRIRAEGELGLSQSRRDPVAFTRGCLRNAQTMEQAWIGRGGLSIQQTSALVRVYSQVARASFACDTPTFETAYAALRRLQPGYTPEEPWHLALASRVVGYRSAEALAVQYRRAKRTLSRVVQPSTR